MPGIFWEEIYCVKFVLIKQSIFAVSVPKEKQLKAVSDEFNQNLLKDLRLCKGVKAKIKMKYDAIPIFRIACPVPFAMKKKVENQLDRLE